MKQKLKEVSLDFIIDKKFNSVKEKELLLQSKIFFFFFLSLAEERGSCIYGGPIEKLNATVEKKTGILGTNLRIGGILPPERVTRGEYFKLFLKISLLKIFTLFYPMQDFRIKYVTNFLHLHS